MEVKLFHKTQRDLATAVNNIIDNYWENDIEENELIKSVQNLYKNNTSKMVKDNGFTTIIKQQCGKRRLEVVERIINMQDIQQ